MFLLRKKKVQKLTFIFSINHHTVEVCDLSSLDILLVLTQIKIIGYRLEVINGVWSLIRVRQTF